MSVRDYQKRTPQWTIGKNFDATGVGQARSPQRWMHRGDVYEVTIEGIGTLSNRILHEDD